MVTILVQHVSMLHLLIDTKHKAEADGNVISFAGI